MKPSVLLLVILISLTNGEILTNGDFENSNFHGNWDCIDCTLTQSTVHHTGHHSGKVTNRHHTWASPGVTFTPQTGKNYVFKAFIKLINNSPGNLYDRVDVLMRITDNNNHDNYKQMASNPMIRVSDSWVEVGGDVHIPSGTKSARVYIQIPEISVNFYVDSASLLVLGHDSHWQSNAQNRIQHTRQAAIHTQVHANGHNTDGYTIEIIQTGNDFAFGTAINAQAIVDPNKKAYQDFFYNNFEWAVIENALKWRLMEWTKGHANFDRPMNAINALLAKGIKIRGHNMFWAVLNNTPMWIRNLYDGALLQECHTHVNDMISHTRGKLLHWDVNNENLHGDFFENHTHNADITQDMFNWIHQLEPNVKLFLNEFSVITSSQSTTAYLQQGKKFKDAGVPIYGMGIQGHFHSADIDIDVVKHRLDKVAESGLRLWITELTVNEADETRKAAALEKLLTLFYSHPSVDGVLLWGFWDEQIYDRNLAIANGPNVTPNAAGRKYQELRKLWTTHQTLSLSTHSLKGYKGTYTLKIKHNGSVIETKHFHLNGDKTITVNLNNQGSTHSTIH